MCSFLCQSYKIVVIHNHNKVEFNSQNTSLEKFAEQLVYLYTCGMLYYLENNLTSTDKAGKKHTH